MKMNHRALANEQEDNPPTIVNHTARLFNQRILEGVTTLADANRDGIGSLADETEGTELEEDLGQRQ
jgi:hypothetical protein